MTSMKNENEPINRLLILLSSSFTTPCMVVRSYWPIHKRFLFGGQPPRVHGPALTHTLSPPSGGSGLSARARNQAATGESRTVRAAFFRRRLSDKVALCQLACARSASGLAVKCL